MDHVFTMHNIEHEIPNRKQQITLTIFGDVHRHAPNCDVPRWKKFCKEQAEGTRHDLQICTGDLDEVASISERKALGRAALHESTQQRLDDMAMSDTQELCDEMWPWTQEGRLLGIIQGNHHWKFMRPPMESQTSTQVIADKLNSRCLGSLSYIRLSIKRKGGGTNLPLDIVIAHGKAGGKLVGTTINQVADLRSIFPMANLYIMGHDHKRGAWPESALQVVTNRHTGEMIVKQKRQYMCRGGSFLRGFVPGQASYVVGMLKKPNELGTVKLFINVVRDCSGGKDSESLHIEALT